MELIKKLPDLLNSCEISLNSGYLNLFKNSDDTGNCEEEIYLSIEGALNFWERFKGDYSIADTVESILKIGKNCVNIYNTCEDLISTYSIVVDKIFNEISLPSFADKTKCKK